MKLVHQISKLITIQETIGGITSHRGERILTIKDGEVKSFPVPTEHKLSLYYTDNFICSVSFACPENQVEKFRAEYIETLLKHIADPINKYFEPVQA